MKNQTIYFKNKPKIIATGTIAGPKESAGIIGALIDYPLKDDMFGEKTYEKAEAKMLTCAIKIIIENANMKDENVDAIVSGDLLNQIISANYAARNYKIPLIGVYGACSTMSESMAIASTLVDGGYFNNVIAATSSHFSSAERQYRYPLELGCTRPPQSQWTVTGAGGCMISKNGVGPEITCATFGRVIDYGITDANNMGAAMAPAAFDTIITHFNNTQLNPDYYDMILTGDLGVFGSEALVDLLWEKGINIKDNHNDCGKIIYNIARDEFQGGSGAGCSATVFNSYIYDKLKSRKLKKILFVATGALLSTVSVQQGESIPCIAHAISIEV